MLLSTTADSEKKNAMVIKTDDSLRAIRSQSPKDRCETF